MSSSKYMARRRFYVPKTEVERDYRKVVCKISGGDDGFILIEEED